MWCSEQQIEWIAADLGLDPIEMRRKNAHHEAYVIPGQATIQSCGIGQCFDEIEQWIKSKGKLPQNRAIGISAAGFMSGGIFNWFDTPYVSQLAMIIINQEALWCSCRCPGDRPGSNTTLAII
jgi:4-hydroxybenzoyl-CoA reductase subunit alpha